jgi:hypothetical protein
LHQNFSVGKSKHNEFDSVPSTDEDVVIAKNGRPANVRLILMVIDRQDFNR